MIWGAIPVSLAAFATNVASSADAAWLVGMLSLGGMIGAIAYGSQAHRFRARPLAIAFACLAPFLLTPLLLATSLATVAPATVLAGIALTPLLSLTNQIISVVAVSGTETEAFAWPYSSTLVGFSVGAAIAGQLIEHSGWRAGLLVSVGASVCVAAIIVATRRGFPNVVPGAEVAEPSPAEVWVEGL